MTLCCTRSILLYRKSPYESAKTLHVGARLRFFVLAWLTLIGDPWCTSVVQHGYYPEMTGQQYRARRPRLRTACTLDSFRESARHVMVTEMLQEEVIEPVGSPLDLFSAIPARARWPLLPEVRDRLHKTRRSRSGRRSSRSQPASRLCAA